MLKQMFFSIRNVQRNCTIEVTAKQYPLFPKLSHKVDAKSKNDFDFDENLFLLIFHFS